MRLNPWPARPRPTGAVLGVWALTGLPRLCDPRSTQIQAHQCSLSTCCAWALPLSRLLSLPQAYSHDRAYVFILGELRFRAMNQLSSLWPENQNLNPRGHPRPPEPFLSITVPSQESAPLGPRAHQPDTRGHSGPLLPPPPHAQPPAGPIGSACQGRFRPLKPTPFPPPPGPRGVSPPQQRLVFGTITLFLLIRAIL